jgi:hypothetical protein
MAFDNAYYHHFGEVLYTGVAAGHLQLPDASQVFSFLSRFSGK